MGLSSRDPATVPDVRTEAPGLSPEEYLGDPLARLLVERWRITPLQLGLATFAFYLISDTIVAWLFGLYDLPAQVTSIAKNWQDTILYDLVVTPIMMGYYL